MISRTRRPAGVIAGAEIYHVVSRGKCRLASIMPSPARVVRDFRIC